MRHQFKWNKASITFFFRPALEDLFLVRCRPKSSIELSESESDPRLLFALLDFDVVAFFPPFGSSVKDAYSDATTE